MHEDRRGAIDDPFKNAQRRPKSGSEFYKIFLSKKIGRKKKMTAVDLTDDMKLAISWTITMINAFVMFTSGLTIDIKEVWKFIKVHFRWAILIGKKNFEI